MEIITGVERGRRWRTEDKLRIVAETQLPGARIADVARRHEISRGLLWNWRHQARRGVLGQHDAPTFVPVRVQAEGTPIMCPPTAGSKSGYRMAQRSGSRAMSA
jgi:transposase